MRLVARVAAGILLCNRLGLPGIGRASGAVPVRLSEARPLSFYAAYLAALSPLTWLRVRRFVRYYCVRQCRVRAPGWACARFHLRPAPFVWTRPFVDVRRGFLMVYRVFDVVREFFLGEGLR